MFSHPCAFHPLMTKLFISEVCQEEWAKIPANYVRLVEGNPYRFNAGSQNLEGNLTKNYENVCQPLSLKMVKKHDGTG